MTAAVTLQHRLNLSRHQGAVLRGDQCQRCDAAGSAWFWQASLGLNAHKPALLAAVCSQLLDTVLAMRYLGCSNQPAAIAFVLSIACYGRVVVNLCSRQYVQLPAPSQTGMCCGTAKLLAACTCWQQMQSINTMSIRALKVL
jgi:hypothetical protein